MRYYIYLKLYFWVGSEAFTNGEALSVSTDILGTKVFLDFVIRLNIFLM